MQKAAATLAAALGLALITSPALAGGWGHSYYPEYYDYPSYGHYGGNGCGSCCNGGGSYQPQNYQPVAAVAIAQGGPQRNGYRNGHGGGYYNGGGCGRRAYYGGCGRW